MPSQLKHSVNIYEIDGMLFMDIVQSVLSVGCLLDDPQFNSGRGKIFSLFENNQASSGAHQAPGSVGAGCSLHRGKAARA
jgi:hypothetical protein